MVFEGDFHLHKREYGKVSHDLGHRSYVTTCDVTWVVI